MNSVSVRDARRALREHGPSAWVEVRRRFGRTYRLQQTVVSGDPEVARAVLTQRPHLERRASPYKLMDRLIPGAPGILFKEG